MVCALLLADNFAVKQDGTLSDLLRDAKKVPSKLGPV